MTLVDVAARDQHWWDHLDPVRAELGRRRLLGSAWWPGAAMSENRGRLTVVSSASDMKTAFACGRRPVLMQHGVGQHYSDRNSTYPGGRGHERCALVLMPNEIAANRHLRFYRERPPVRVVGSPRLDDLAQIPRREIPGSVPVVAVTWHWPMTAMGVYGGTAFTEIGPEVMAQLVRMRDLGFVTLLGHAHPRAREMVAETYAGLEVPFVEDFTDVVAMADCLVADNTSVLFEFAALDRPVVVIDSPKWRAGVKFPPRFWSHADVGPRTSDPEAVPGKVAEALAEEPQMVANRRAISDDLFPYRGEAASRAVDAILALGGA